MNVKKKMIVAAIMATMFSVSVGFPQTAEAGIFGDIGKSIGDVFGKGKGGGINVGGSIEDTIKNTAKDAIKKAAKEALAKALNVDIDKISDKKASMMQNLSNATICYLQSYINVSKAFNLDSGNRQRMEAAANNLRNDRTNFGSIKAAADATYFDPKKFDERVKQMTAEVVSPEEAEKINGHLQAAKTQRQAANIYKVLALRDAGFVLSGALKNLTKANKFSDLKHMSNTFKDLSETAKAAKAILGEMDKKRKLLTGVLKNYEKKNNIKDVSDEEAKKQVANLVMQ